MAKYRTGFPGLLKADRGKACHRMSASKATGRVVQPPAFLKLLINEPGQSYQGLTGTPHRGVGAQLNPGTYSKGYPAMFAAVDSSRVQPPMG